MSRLWYGQVTERHQNFSLPRSGLLYGALAGLRVLVCLTLLMASFGRAMAQDAPVVAAAADLQFALEEVAQTFYQKTGKAVRLTFGSSGNFAQQIQNGAPFELFLSADEGYVRGLAVRGLTLNEGVLYAIGRIVLFIPRSSPLRTDEEMRDLRAALADRLVRKFAIANPEHAPYGRAAREALQHQGLWDAVQPYLVLGESASQAAQFAASGSAQGGIIPLSLAQAPEVSKRGDFALLPAEWHQPLQQRMVLLRQAGETAKAFYDYLQTPPARAILVRYGFALPGER
jgi:molybdate transport system substrate-binding protein